MIRKDKVERIFVVKIILPTLLTAILFGATIFGVLIPRIETNIMSGKREMISELTNSALSILEKYHTQAKNGRISTEDAQKQAIEHIERLRYGHENKDYFWITDEYPRMIMHPYRSDLNGRDLSDYQDRSGKKPFVEFVNIVKEKKEGYVEYFWQWKDDSAHVVPKLSFVKEYKPWSWIVGTGVYLQDVRHEMRIITNRLIIISGSITGFVALLLFMIVQQSLRAEMRRAAAEAKLTESEAKYKKLAESVAQGVLMIIENKIAYTNAPFLKLTGYNENDIESIDIEILISNFDELSTKTNSQLFQATLHTKSGKSIAVQISKQETNVLNKSAIILSINELQLSDLASELTSENYCKLFSDLKLGVFTATFDLRGNLIQANEYFKEIMKLPAERDTSRIRIFDLLTDKSERKKIIEALEYQHSLKNVVLQIRNFSGEALTVLLSLRVAARDGNFVCEGIVENITDRPATQKILTNFTGTTLKTTDNLKLNDNFEGVIQFVLKSNSVSELSALYNTLQQILTPYISIDTSAKYLTGRVSDISDAITCKIIQFAEIELGKPPTSYAFFALGSAGRKEQTLLTDQDNALIYNIVSEDKKASVKAYFLSFGTFVCDALNTVGYNYCTGNFMAKNPDWNQDEGVWKNYFHKWISEPVPKHLLDISIFFDFKFVAGDESLLNSLTDYVRAFVPENDLFLFHNARNFNSLKPSISFRGHLLAETSGQHTDCINLKNSVGIFVMFARIYALKHNIKSTNTYERILELFHLQIIDKQLFEEFAFAFETLLKFRFAHQFNQIQRSINPDNYLNIKFLTNSETDILKRALSVESQLMRRISLDFNLRTGV